jgi:hypothetical protein
VPNDVDDVSHAEFTDPRRFLLRDESVEDYEFQLGQLLVDLSPANSLERRQVELIAQADLDIERQQRIISVYLQPSKAGGPTKRAVAGWRHDTFMHLKYGDDWAGRAGVEADPGPVFGDFGAMPAITSAYGANFGMLEFHYRAQSEAERRRRMAIGLLLQLQDRRARRAVPDAQVVDG